MAIHNSRPPRLPCAKGAVSRRLTEGLSGVDGPFGDDLCRNSNPSLATTAANAPLCATTQGNRGGSPQSPVGHDDPGVPFPRPPRGVGADAHD